MKLQLRTLNSILLVLIIVVNGYVIGAPLLPALIFNYEKHGNRQSTLVRTIHDATSQTNKIALNNSPNSVIIPSMLLDQPILEGSIAQTYHILDQGIWRWPNGSTPDKGGNTVLIGHRFTYTNPKGVFYYLNKVAIGNQVGVFWNHQEYLYEVQKIEQVSPNDTAIEANTSNPELTLFTCTPLLLPKDRLVVVADLEPSTGK
jgi:LPXTG-site transpeptidase (sortase) family protein